MGRSDNLNNNKMPKSILIALYLIEKKGQSSRVEIIATLGQTVGTGGQLNKWHKLPVLGLDSARIQ